MSTTTTICLFCNTSFKAENKFLNRGDAKFCSVSCGLRFNAALKRKPNTICSWCNTKYYLRPSRKNNNRSKSGLFFCCIDHKNLAQKNGMFRASHYNNGINVYRKNTIKINSLCNRCNFKGKYSDSLIVHHIDRNRQNNIHANLEILCRNCHYEEHRDELMNAMSNARNTKFKIDWPPLDKLKDMVRSSSYLSVSKKLGVSDTAVKYHIKHRDPNFKKKL